MVRIYLDNKDSRIKEIKIVTALAIKKSVFLRECIIKLAFYPALVSCSDCIV